MELDSNFDLVSNLGEGMLVIKKARRREPYVPDPNQTVRGKRINDPNSPDYIPKRADYQAAAAERKQVQNPGSRGGHWYYDKNHQVQYGDPPSGHSGFHSGDFHQMFVQHAPNKIAQKYLTEHVVNKAKVNKHDEKTLMHAGMEVTHGQHGTTIEDLRDKRLRNPDNAKFKKMHEDAIDKFGENLEAIHAGLVKHGLDKDTQLSRKYMDMRRHHAQHLVDIDRLTVKLPTTDELKALPFPKSHQDIINYANSYLPHTHFDIEDMDLETADALVFQFFSLAKDHPPEMFRALQHFGTRSINSSYPLDWESDEVFDVSFAHMADTNELMGFNPKFAASISYFRRTLDDNFRKGWLVSGEVKDVVTHEFGHMIDNYYSNADSTALLMMEWKQAHADTEPPSSGYARDDDAWLTQINFEYSQTGYKEENWRPLFQRSEQWAESHVSHITKSDPADLNEYETHQRRLLEFIRDNPDLSDERVYTKEELAHMGIHGPYRFLQVEGEEDIWGK